MPETINIAKGIADMNIGNRIKNRRIELGMTQQELAVKIGSTPIFCTILKP